MPQWMHDRAKHIMAKNPSMPESEAFAIATQQSHALGKSPKGYGTPQGRHEAKEKYNTPGDDKKTADPGGVGKEHEEASGKSKTAQIRHLLPFLDGFSDELQKIAGALQGAPTTVSEIKSTIPRSTMKSAPKYTKVNPEAPATPIAQHQPVLSPPAVRG